MRVAFIKLVDDDTYLNINRIESVYSQQPSGRTGIEMANSPGNVTFWTTEKPFDFVDRAMGISRRANNGPKN